jgi:hypothetical protein
VAKVTAYTVATEPLDGTEVFYAVQGSNSRQTNVAAVWGGVPLAPVSMIRLQTAIAAASQASIDFTGIPAWANRISVMFEGLGTNGTNPVVIRPGTSGGPEVTGFLGSTSSMTAAAVVTQQSTVGFRTETTTVAAAGRIRVGTFSIVRAFGNGWVASGVMGFSDTTGTNILGYFKSMPGALDRIRVTTEGGGDLFNAGNVSISWE